MIQALFIPINALIGGIVAILILEYGHSREWGWPRIIVTVLVAALAVGMILVALHI